MSRCPRAGPGLRRDNGSFPQIRFTRSPDRACPGHPRLDAFPNGVSSACRPPYTAALLPSAAAGIRAPRLEGAASAVGVSSMTGFARSEGEADGISWIWEARSVNGRSLELRLRLPPGFEPLEPPLRAALAQRCRRGNIAATLSVTRL